MGRRKLQLAKAEYSDFQYEDSKVPKMRGVFVKPTDEDDNQTDWRTMS